MNNAWLNRDKQVSQYYTHCYWIADGVKSNTSQLPHFAIPTTINGVVLPVDHECVHIDNGLKCVNLHFFS